MVGQYFGGMGSGWSGCNGGEKLQKIEGDARHKGCVCDGVLCDSFVVNGMVCMNALHGFIGREWMGEHVNGSQEGMIKEGMHVE